MVLYRPPNLCFCVLFANYSLEKMALLKRARKPATTQRQGDLNSPFSHLLLTSIKSWDEPLYDCNMGLDQRVNLSSIYYIQTGRIPPCKCTSGICGV